MNDNFTVQRLKTRSQFIYLRDNGNKIVTPYFVLQYASINHIPCFAHYNASDCAVGFTVTKKLGNAVRRNRIKRRLREAVRLTFPELACHGYAYVIIGRSHAHHADFEDITKHVRKSMRRIHKVVEAA